MKDTEVLRDGVADTESVRITLKEEEPLGDTDELAVADTEYEKVDDNESDNDAEKENVTDPEMDGLWDGDKVRVLLLLDVPLIVTLGDEVGDVLREEVSETDSVPLVLKDIVALCDTDKLVV